MIAMINNLFSITIIGLSALLSIILYPFYYWRCLYVGMISNITNKKEKPQQLMNFKFILLNCVIIAIIRYFIAPFILFFTSCSLHIEDLEKFNNLCYLCEHLNIISEDEASNFVYSNETKYKEIYKNLSKLEHMIKTGSNHVKEESLCIKKTRYQFIKQCESATELAKEYRDTNPEKIPTKSCDTKVEKQKDCEEEKENDCCCRPRIIEKTFIFIKSLLPPYNDCENECDCCNK